MFKAKLGYIIRRYLKFAKFMEKKKSHNFRYGYYFENASLV